MTFTGAIGAACMFPLRLVIRLCVRLRIHPNLLTFLGVIINAVAAWYLSHANFVTAGVIIVVANIFDMIDGKVAIETNQISRFGAFWDSTIDRFSDLALFTGLVCLYAARGSVHYVLITSLATIFALMTSYARARAESLIPRCKVGFMERPERIVLFMIGAFTNRMAAVMWVIMVLAMVTVIDRVYYTWIELSDRQQPSRDGVSGFFVRAFYWMDERATLSYDLWVIAILAFIWLVPPDWISDPNAHGPNFINWTIQHLR